MTDKKRSIYSNLLCDLCKDKTHKLFCNGCKLKYKRACHNKSYQKNGKKVKNNQTNQPNLLNHDSSNSVISTGVENEENENEVVNSANASSADNKNGKLSIYADLFCALCKNKPHKEICPGCKSKYTCATSIKSYEKTKKKPLETINLNNQSNLTEQTQQVHEGNTDNGDSFSKKSKPNSIGTIRNKITKVKKIAGTTENQRKVGVGLIQSLPKHEKKKAVKCLNIQFEQIIRAEMSTEIVQNVKEKCGKKSEAAYVVMNSVAKNVEGQTQSKIKKRLGLGWKNAGKVKSRVLLSRKKYRKKLTPEVINKIIGFWERDDISRLEPSKRVSKKKGPKRYMLFSLKEAYIMFKNEETDNQVCFSNFYKFKPKNVEVSSKTPIISSLCPYCMNIRLKLPKLGIPNLKKEYDLIKLLICDKGQNSLEHADCVKNKCKECFNLVGKLETLCNGKHKDTDIFKWYTWKKESITKPNGKKIVRRNLKFMDKTFKDFKEELYEDIFHPAERFSFIEHYMAQKFQFKAYKECLSSLKGGQCLMVQDFARNRDIEYQDEIKSQWWTKQQVTLHPTVLFYRLEDEGKIHRLVVSHLSDIINHDAHLVHYMSLECISILKEKHCNVEWSKVFLWSDGCASQYKGKISFFYLDKFPIDVERNFFASEHGKGPSDAETGLISMKLRNATKSRRTVIQNASDMHKFLTETNKDTQKIFKLVQSDDLQPLLDEFDGVNVSTLQGTVTRSLHQIMTSNQKGYILQRPFSCFCTHCTMEDFANCEKKGYTNGNFSKHKLPSTAVFNENVDEYVEDENEDEVEEILDDYFQFYVDEDVETIKSENQNLLLDQLSPNKYVIVALKSQGKKCRLSEFVAKINIIDNENEISVDYLEQNKEFKDKFRYIIHEKNQDVRLCEIVMLLPDPDCIYRGGVTFPKRICLKKNVNV